MKFINILLLSILFGGLSSCSPFPVISMDSAQHVPLMEYKGEVQVSAGIGTETWGFEAAWAPTPHFEIAGAVSQGQNHILRQVGRKLDCDCSTTDGTRMSGEFAFGYYSKIYPDFPIEFFAGVERYSRQFSEGSFSGGPPNYYEANYQLNVSRPFVQGAVGKRLWPGATVAVSIRAGINYYDHFTISGYSEDSLGIITNYNYAPHTPPNLIIEPALTFLFGKRRLKFSFQAGASYPWKKVTMNRIQGSLTLG